MELTPANRLYIFMLEWIASQRVRSNNIPNSLSRIASKLTLISCNASHTTLVYKNESFSYSFGNSKIDYENFVALIPPVVQYVSSSSSMPVFIVIIRTYIGHQLHLIRLLRGLIKQTETRQAIQVKIYILCTEYNSLSPIHQLLTTYMPRLLPSIQRPFEINLFNFTEPFYLDEDFNPLAKRLQYLCSPPYISVMKARWGLTANEIRRTCAMNNPVHYFLTDLSIHYALRSCENCRYLLITNGDNYYYKSYLMTVLPHIENGRFDMTLSSWNHRGIMKSVLSPSLGQVDLGCAIFSIPLLRSMNSTSLVNSLPSCADARDFYAADGHYIKRLVNMDARYKILEHRLFDHN